MEKARKGRIKTRRKKLLRLLCLSLFLLGLAVYAEWRLAPRLAVLAAQQAHAMAMAEVAKAARQEIAQAEAVNYQELMHFERDEQGYITLLTMDTALVNQVMSDTALTVEASLEDMSKEKLSLPLGVLSGSEILSGFGPEISFRMRAASAPTITLEDDFLSAGINQTLHSIYLNIKTEIRIIVPFSEETTEVEVRLLLAEGIIVGYTPDTYLSLTN